MIKLSRQMRVSVIIASLTLALTQFQNCGQADVASLPGEAASTEVRLVDQWSEQKVLFVQSEMSLPEQGNDAVVAGWCARSNYNQFIDWHLLDTDGQVVASGEALCERGGFAVELENIQGLSCNHMYLLQAEGLEGQAEATLRRGCDPIKTAQSR